MTKATKDSQDACEGQETDRSNFKNLGASADAVEAELSSIDL